MIDERKIIRAVESVGYRASVAGQEEVQNNRAARLADTARLADDSFEFSAEIA